LFFGRTKLPELLFQGFVEIFLGDTFHMYY
jgi:hypothetical protein